MTTDTYNFHWKDGSSHRGTKESGKRSTHAAHDHDMFIFDRQNGRSFPIAFPILPPICRAAPSRPADPPNRCVISVGNKDQRSHAHGAARHPSGWQR